jgi:hypothetical protein
MADQSYILWIFFAAVILLDIAALRWGADSRTAVLMRDPNRPDI